MDEKEELRLAQKMLIMAEGKDIGSAAANIFEIAKKSNNKMVKKLETAAEDCVYDFEGKGILIYLTSIVIGTM